TRSVRAPFAGGARANDAARARGRQPAESTCRARRFPHAGDELEWIDGLEQHFGGAEIARRAQPRTDRTDGDHRSVGLRKLDDPPDQLEAVEARHDQVGDDDLRMEAFEEVES